jgi:hypothetical protein
VIAPNAGGDATIAVKGTYTIGIAAGESFSIHNLAMRNATATLDVAGQLNLSGVLTLARGTIRLDNGGGVAGSVTVAAGATLVGAGTVDGAAQSAGTIEASGGALTIAGPVTGTGGALLIDNGATLNLGAAVSGDNIAFAAAGKSVLTLGAAGSVASAISGFATGDAIDLEKLRATSDSYAGGVLSLFDGAARVASLSIVGSYAGQVFALSADGAGGTDVTLAPAATSSHNLALFAQAIAAFGPTEAWVTGRADGLALEQRHFDLALARQ